MLGHAVSEAAPAKVNLALHVTGQRQDGFHRLHSLCVFTELADHVTVAPAAADSLNVCGPFAPDMPTGRSNLVTRALEKFRNRFPKALEHGVAISLDKHLPVAAGLGGGSADAAAVLRALARLSTHAIADADLFALASTLGADVPMCVLSRPCEVTGIGERIRPLNGFPAMHLVLVNPGVPVPTPEVFRRLVDRVNEPMPGLPDVFERAALVSLWLEETRNDLEPPATEIVPAIAEILSALAITPGCSHARMSGSGATCFGLYGSASAAHQAAHDLRARMPQYWVAATPILVQ